VLPSVDVSMWSLGLFGIINLALLVFSIFDAFGFPCSWTVHTVSGEVPPRPIPSARRIVGPLHALSATVEAAPTFGLAPSAIARLVGLSGRPSCQRHHPGASPPTISRHPYARIVITERRVVGVEPRILCGVLGFNATETPVLGGVLSLNDAQPATCALVLVLGPFGAFAEMT
jgi:hypothetical protein